MLGRQCEDPDQDTVKDFSRYTDHKCNMTGVKQLRAQRHVSSELKLVCYITCEPETPLCLLINVMVLIYPCLLLSWVLFLLNGCYGESFEVYALCHTLSLNLINEAVSYLVRRWIDTKKFVCYAVSIAPMLFKKYLDMAIRCRITVTNGEQMFYFISQISSSISSFYVIKVIFLSSNIPMWYKTTTFQPFFWLLWTLLQRLKELGVWYCTKLLASCRHYTSKVTLSAWYVDLSFIRLPSMEIRSAMLKAAWPEVAMTS